MTVSSTDQIKSYPLGVHTVPAGCTGELQPRDVSVNEQFKASMKAHFAYWYSNGVNESLKLGLDFSQLFRRKTPILI